MGVDIMLSCDGCFEKTGPHRLPHRKFRSFSGNAHGFGVWENPTIDSAPYPDGWVRSDPYTGCTYCPACWQEIERGEHRESDDA